MGLLGALLNPAFLTSNSAFAAVETNDSRAQSLIAYLKKHQSVIQRKGENHYYRQVLWSLIAIDFKTLSGPTKREILKLLFDWIGGNLDEIQAKEIREALEKKQLGEELDKYFDPLRMAVLKEVDARDLSRALRDALKQAYGKLKMSEAGMKRLEIFDKDEERFVNEMLFAGVMPSVSSDLAKLGNDLITNLAGNVINGGFTADQFATMAKNIAKVLGIQNSTTGKLLQEAVNSKIVQDVAGQGKMPEILNRVSDIRSRLERDGAEPNIARPMISKSGQPSLGDLYEQAQKRESKSLGTPSSHSTNSIKAPAIRAKAPLKMDRTYESGASLPRSSEGGTQSPSTKQKVSSTDSSPPAASKAEPQKLDPKLEAAKEIVDPRELLGGSFVYKNPKFAATDPNLQDKKEKVLGPYESKHFEEARQASIKAGPVVGTCDVKAVRSDKYCEQCGKDSKPCKCYEGMLKTVQEYEMRANAPISSSDVVEERVRETGQAVEVSVKAAFKKKADELRAQMSDSKLSAKERKQVEEDLRAIDYQEKQASPDRAFYIKKVLLNGVMNTKTPACVLNKGRYGAGATRDRETEPQWIYPGERYCHQFDLKPDEPFEALSKQDSILLRLSMATLEGLEESSLKGNMKMAKFDELYSPSFKINESQVCSSKKLCTLPKAPSRKDLYYRIFADESQDKNVRGLFDGETENTIARTLLRCFDPRSWGGMIIAMVEHLSVAAKACGSKAATELVPSLLDNSVLKIACSGQFHEVSNGSAEISPQKMAEAFKSYGPKVLPFDRSGSADPQKFCESINGRFVSLLDILGAATQLNHAEICAPNQVKLYEKNTSSHK